MKTFMGEIRKHCQRDMAMRVNTLEKWEQERQQLLK